MTKLENYNNTIFESIKHNEWLNSKEFWEGVIESMIQEEKTKNEIATKELLAIENEEQKQTRISNIAFSQVLPYSNNMLDFQIDKKIIFEVVNSFVKKYNINKDLEEAIVMNVKERVYEDNKEEGNKDKKEEGHN